MHWSQTRKLPGYFSWTTWRENSIYYCLFLYKLKAKWGKQINQMYLSCILHFRRIKGLKKKKLPLHLQKRNLEKHRMLLFFYAPLFNCVWFQTSLNWPFILQESKVVIFLMELAVMCWGAQFFPFGKKRLAWGGGKRSQEWLEERRLLRTCYSRLMALNIEPAITGRVKQACGGSNLGLCQRKWVHVLNPGICMVGCQGRA